MSLTSPFASMHHVAWASFAPSFVDDVNRYVASVTADPRHMTPRRFDETAKLQQSVVPVQETTARRHAFALRRCAILLASARGCELPEIGGLAELVAPGSPTAILNRMRDERGNCPAMLGLIQALSQVARRYIVVPTEMAVALQNLSRQAHRGDQLRRRREFLDEITADHVTTLLRLPEQLAASVDGQLKRHGTLTRSDVLDARMAACLALLPHVPLSIGRLEAVELGWRISLTRPPGFDGRLRFPDRSEMKTAIALDLRVTGRVLDVLTWYVTAVRPLLGIQHPTALFKEPYAPRWGRGLRAEVAAVVLARTGLRLDPRRLHVYRHLMRAALAEEDSQAWASLGNGRAPSIGEAA